MKIFTVIPALLLAFPATAFAQDPVADTPEKAVIITSDINNFWNAWDRMETSPERNPFEEYIAKGSYGVQNFLAHNRIVNADSLLGTVKRHKNDYLATRAYAAGMDRVRLQCLSHYYALEYLYPDAVYPPLYFVIGRFNTGGVATPEMQIIGSEMNSPDNISYIVAHELIHAQQNIPYKYRILLEQCIIEGSADFLGELISGRIASTAPYEYAKGREVQLWEEFSKDMNFGENDDFSNWLYGAPRTDGRPNDMGYYIGYIITKAYYDKATDKRKAIKEILNIKDCREFLKASAYNPVNSTATAPPALVTFNCGSCKGKTQLELSGAENHMLKNARFPIKVKLKPGTYNLRYFQNNVLQIQQAFEVKAATSITIK